MPFFKRKQVFCLFKNNERKAKKNTQKPKKTKRK